jgi:hypothetical protein
VSSPARTIPLLPCRSIDEIADFYAALGFAVTYRQERPYPCIGLCREDIDMQFFGISEFVAEDSYGSCIVEVDDTEPLYRAFADGLRAAHGRVPVSGIPRMTRPRRRQGATMGFTVVDPGGNWIRFFRRKRDAAEAAPDFDGKLDRALYNAGILGDSKGDAATAAKVLDRTLAADTAADAVTRVEALSYLAELSVAAGDLPRAAAAVAELHAIDLSATERDRLGSALDRVRDVESALAAA